MAARMQEEKAFSSGATARSALHAPRSRTSLAGSLAGSPGRTAGSLGRTAGSLGRTAGSLGRVLVCTVRLAVGLGVPSLGVPLAVGALASSSLAGCAFGVEQYREAAPDPSLVLRVVGDDAHAAVDALPDLEGHAIPLAGTVLRAEHIEHVELVRTGEGERVLTLLVTDVGRTRLRETTSGVPSLRLALVAHGVVLATPAVRGTLDEHEIALRVPPSRVTDAFRRASAPSP